MVITCFISKIDQSGGNFTIKNNINNSNDGQSNGPNNNNNNNGPNNGQVILVKVADWCLENLLDYVSTINILKRNKVYILKIGSDYYVRKEDVLNGAIEDHFYVSQQKAKTRSEFAKKKAVFIDVDMGAAHTRIARYLFHNSKSELDSSLKDPSFWNAQIKLVKPIYEAKNISLPDKTIKKMLKVGLYTSMNGGNPSSEARLNANLVINTGSYLMLNKIHSQEELKESSLYKATELLMQNFQLEKEVKSLN